MHPLASGLKYLHILPNLVPPSLHRTTSLICSVNMCSTAPNYLNLPSLISRLTVSGPNSSLNSAFFSILSVQTHTTIKTYSLRFYLTSPHALSLAKSRCHVSDSCCPAAQLIVSEHWRCNLFLLMCKEKILKFCCQLPKFILQSTFLHEKLLVSIYENFKPEEYHVHEHTPF